MDPVRARRWKLLHPDAEAVEEISRELGLPPLIGRLLVNRGFREPAEARRFLSPTLADLHDSFLLRDMDAAVARLVRALRRGETVCVYGDYDVDGITSTALLVSFFRRIGFTCLHHIPHRMEEGYGLSRQGIECVSSRGASLIVTVDCGITALEEAAFCGELGIDLIVTDHHTPGDILPSACAVINPHRTDCPFPFKGLAGVGVAFHLVIALRARLREEGYFTCGEPTLRDYLDLVTLGTVADLVPLLDENRIFVSFGLREMGRSPRPGIEALKRVSAVAGEVSCSAVGFRLAPRINACGRLEDAARALELLLTEDAQRAAVLAEELDAANGERQGIERQIMLEALEAVRSIPAAAARRSIVLASETWHPGVVGIVASRLVDLYHRPTILISLAEGSGKGSGRSIPAFPLHDALCECSRLLVKFGGHRYAAGLTVRESELEEFVREFDAVASALLSEEDLVPELAADAEILPEELTLALVEGVARLEPFGKGNREPLFLLRGAGVREKRVLKEQHLKMRLQAAGSAFDAIGFNMADTPCAGTIDLLFSPQLNEWGGRRGVQLRLRDLCDAASPRVTA